MLREGTKYEVAIADLTFAADSALGVVVAAIPALAGEMSAPRAAPRRSRSQSYGEKAAVLDELVAGDLELKDRAERAARAARPGRYAANMTLKGGC